MAPTLTPARLRALAKLYRGGVDGAADALHDVIAEHGSELPELVGFPESRLCVLRDAPNAVELLVTTIERAGRVERDARMRAEREGARALAVGLARTSRVHDRSVELDPVGLRNVLAAWPGQGVVAFDARGGVEVGLLRAVLQRCSRVRSMSICVSRRSVVVAYASEHARGGLRLALHRIDASDDVLVVPIDTVDREHDVQRVNTVAADAKAVRRDVVQVAVHSAELDEAGTCPTGGGPSCPDVVPGGDETPTRAQPTPTPRVEARRRLARGRQKRGVMARLIEAIAAAVGGAR